MTGITKFWNGFWKGYRADGSPNAEEPRKGWFESIVALIGIVAARSSFLAYRAGGWRYLLLCIGVAVGAVAALWCLRMLWFVLFRPLFMFFVDEGVVGCWRWLRDKVFLTTAAGRQTSCRGLWTWGSSCG